MLQKGVASLDEVLLFLCCFSVVSLSTLAEPKGKTTYSQVSATEPFIFLILGAGVHHSGRRTRCLSAAPLGRTAAHDQQLHDSPHQDTPTAPFHRCSIVAQRILTTRDRL